MKMQFILNCKAHMPWMQMCIKVVQIALFIAHHCHQNSDRNLPAPYKPHQMLFPIKRNLKDFYFAKPFGLFGIA